MKRLSIARAAVVAFVLTAFLAFSGGVVMPAPTQAAVAAPSVASLKAQAIYFQQKGKVARRDLAVSSIESASTWQGRLWSEFVAEWATTNNYLKMHSAVPKGLPTKGHVFVVLGSALTKSGKLSTKLERRLKLALAALKKYPRSKVLVSGGAPRNGHTEAGVMASWLKGKGIADARILVEKKSSSTVGNAANSMAMLAKSGQYTSYTLVTDSSHMRRSSILFAAAKVLLQEQSGQPLKLEPVANLAFMDMPEAGRKPLSASSVAYTASNVASVLKLSAHYKAVLSAPPAKPVLTSLEVVAPESVTYQVGQDATDQQLLVRAVYNKGAYTKVVTGSARFTGFDSMRVGAGSARITYTDDKVSKTATFAYSVVKATSKVSLKLSTAELKRRQTRMVVTASVTTSAKVSPTGKLRFYLDGRRLATVKVDASGTVKYKVGRLSRTGERKLVVKYFADPLLDPAKRTAVVTVVR